MQCFHFQGVAEGVVLSCTFLYRFRHGFTGGDRNGTEEIRTTDNSDEQGWEGLVDFNMR